MKIEKIFGKLHKKSEEERLRVLWFLVGISMLIVFGVWLFSFNHSLHNLKKINLDASKLSSFSETKQQVAELNDVISQGSKVLESAGTNLSQEYWQNVSQEYLAKEKPLGDDAFSELKISGAENSNGVVVMKYEHYYKGLLVYGSNLTLYFDANSGEFIKSEDNLKKRVDVGIDPIIDSQKAVEIAKRQFAGTEVVFKNSSLVVVSIDGVYYLAWHLFFENPKDSGEMQIFVGAKNGGLILPEELDK